MFIWLAIKAHMQKKKKQQQIELKEVKFRPKTGDHDFDVKVKSLRRFLEKGNKGKVSVMFRGREIVHPDVGREMLNRVIQALGDEALIEQNPRLEGRQMVMMIAPGKKKTGGATKPAAEVAPAAAA